MARVKATFYLPIRDNDGRDLSTEILDVENECYQAFEGWTLSGYFRGTWRMKDGERRIDTSAVYSIILAEEEVAVLESISAELGPGPNRRPCISKSNGT